MNKLTFPSGSSLARFADDFFETGSDALDFHLDGAIVRPELVAALALPSSHFVTPTDESLPGPALFPAVADTAHWLLFPSTGASVLLASATDGQSSAVTPADASAAPFMSGGGKTTTHIGTAGTSNYGSELYLQADGKMVLVGSSAGADASSPFAIVRYKADGTLDTAFGSGGKLTTKISSGFDQAAGVQVQADGRITVAGGAAGADGLSVVALARYSGSGVLDSSFDGDGKLTRDFSASSAIGDQATSVAVLAGGKILVSGSFGLDFGLFRLNTNGSLDSTFGSAGKVTVDFGAAYAASAGMAVQTDGRILLAGGVIPAGPLDDSRDFALVRYLADGAIDTSFSADGKLTTDFGGIDSASSLTVQADGQILLAGSSDAHFSVARYNTNGSLDTTFGGDGKISTAFGAHASATSIAMQSDGKLLVGGYSSGLSGNDFALARYLSNGNLDTSFGSAGKITTDFGGDDYGNSLVVQADGRIVLAGSSGADFALARYNKDGSLDSAFGSADLVAPRVLAYAPTASATGVAVGVNIVATFSETIQRGSGSILLKTAAGAPVASYDVASSSNLTFNAATLTVNPSANLAYSTAYRLEFAAGTVKDLVGNGTVAASSLQFTTITAPNNPPTAGNRTLSTPEDHARALAVADFGFADVDAGSSLRSVTLTSLPAHGALTLGGLAVVVNQGVSAAQLGAGSLLFTPAAHAYGAAYASFGFKVSDGLALSVAAYTMTVNVTAVRDDLVLTGGSGNDTLAGDLIDAGSFDKLSGLAGRDRLSGKAGNDTLDGGTGIDTLTGGTGSDSYGVDNSTDVISETSTLAGEIDSVTSSVAWTLGSYLEKLTLTGSTAINGTGNTLANTITGNGGANQLAGSSGNDTLSGGSGNDRLDGGTGTDSLVGGAGNDNYTVDSSTDRITETTTVVTEIDSVTSSVAWTLGSYLEKLTLTGSTAINGTGNTLANTLTGNTGNNSLNGSSGNDALVGGGGSDTLVGGTGNDSYTVDSGSDVISEKTTTTTEIDSVTSSVTWTLGSNLERLTLTGSGTLSATGNTLANTITGNSGYNALNGSSGNDTLNGGGGNDTLSGSTGLDTFRFSSALNGSSNADTVKDFVAVNDAIQLENSVFLKLTAIGALNALFFRASSAGAAADSNDYINYATDTGKLFYDADGNGAGAAVLFATLTGEPTLSSADIFVT